jgi:NAD(P)-dependent dehydrogenase (short-subunit alcohol dehydrogenase family)
LITGASSRISTTTAQILAEEGADIVSAYGQDRVGATDCAQTVESYLMDAVFGFVRWI